MIINYIIIFNLLYILQADQLLSVHIIWRHGARKPYFCNYNCTSEQLSQLSQLTSTGMRQQYVLGQWIKQKYIDTGFLSSIFNENEIYIESSDTNRTIMSAYSNLMGMYPEGFNVPNISDSFLLPPIKDIKTPDGLYNYALPNHMALIPIHSIQNDKDYYMYMYCPILWDEGKHNQNTDIFYDINNKTIPLINRVNKELNLNLTNIVQLYEWRDTFISNIYNGEENPKELTPSLMSELDKIAGLGFLLQYTQDYYQAQLLTSEFFRILLNEQDNIINQTSKIKYHAFSAHDSTIYALLYALNLTNVECYNQTYFEGKSNQSTCITTYPDFTANIIFELYNNPINGPYIKLMYNGTYMNICHSKATTCQYTHFKSIIKGIILDYKKECQIEEQQIQIQQKTPIWAIIFFIFTILFTLITIIGVLYMKNKKQQDNKSQEQINDLNF